MFNI
jgi:hypothetical protein